MKNNENQKPRNGWVYIIHFDEKFHHAGHYIGFALNVEGRLYYHKKGTGSKLLAALNRAGIGYKIVRVLAGDRNLERKLKNKKNTAALCPICQKAHLLARNQRARNRKEIKVIDDIFSYKVLAA